MQSTEGENGTASSQRGIHALCRVETKQRITSQSRRAHAHAIRTRIQFHLQNPNNSPKTLNRVRATRLTTTRPSPKKPMPESSPKDPESRACNSPHNDTSKP
jgi:hypothetical protein